MSGHIFDGRIDEGLYQEPVPEQPIGPEHGTQEWARARLAALRERVKTAGRGAGYEKRTQEFRERLNRMIDELVAEQHDGILTIEMKVLEAIRNEELGSIR